MNASLFFKMLDGMAEAVIVVGEDQRISLFKENQGQVYYLAS